MKRLLKSLIPALALLLSATGWALEVPPFSGLVVDQAAVLTPADRSRVTARLEAFQSATTGQMAVLIVPTLKGDPIEEFGIRVGDAWKVGKAGRDDGLILIVALQDRDMRLEVGYGLEGVVNDARAGDVIREMGPAFREGRYADGIIGAVATLEAFLKPGAAPPSADVRPAAEKQPAWVKAVVFLFFFGFIVLFGWLSRFSKGGRSGSGGSGGSRGGGGGFSGGGGGRFGGGGASGKW